MNTGQSKKSESRKAGAQSAGGGRAKVRHCGRPECGTADAGAPRDELDLAASMIWSRNGPHARHSPSHDQRGLYVRSARRFRQVPRENDAAQPLLADLGGFLDQRFDGADGAVNTGQSEKIGVKKGLERRAQSKRPLRPSSKAQLNLLVSRHRCLMGVAGEARAVERSWLVAAAG